MANCACDPARIIRQKGSFGTFNDIMDIDPVATADKIRKPTIEKLKAFIAKHEVVFDKEPAPTGVTRARSSTNPFPPDPPKKKTPDPEPPAPSPSGDRRPSLKH